MLSLIFTKLIISLGLKLTLQDEWHLNAALRCLIIKLNYYILIQIFLIDKSNILCQIFISTYVANVSELPF